MNRCCLLTAALACAFLAAGEQALAQTEPAETMTDRLHALEASRQAVVLPLNGALDPEVPEEEPAAAEAAEAPTDYLAPQADSEGPGSPPLESEVAGVTQAPAEETGEPSIADLTGEPQADAAPAAEVEAEAAVIEEEAADSAMLPDLDGIDGIVVAELGNPESIGPYRLWLASFRTVREAQAGWQQLAKDNRDVLGDLVPVIVMKELGGDSGTFFRLQAGPLADEAQAQTRCDALKSRTLYCAILGPQDG